MPTALIIGSGPGAAGAALALAARFEPTLSSGSSDRRRMCRTLRSSRGSESHCNRSSPLVPRLHRFTLSGLLGGRPGVKQGSEAAVTGWSANSRFQPCSSRGHSCHVARAVCNCVIWMNDEIMSTR